MHYSLTAALLFEIPDKPVGDHTHAGEHDAPITRGPQVIESASDQPLKILRMSARDPRAEAKRMNYEDLKGWQGHLGGERVTARK